MYPISTGL